MFSAPFTTQAFPKGIASTGDIRFSPGELAHALFVTGKAPGDRLKHGRASYWEFIHRGALIPAYLRYAPSGRIARSRLALEFDRSEKVNLSYSLGQSLTQIFCERILRITHLMHVDRYATTYDLDFGSSRQRPDLFGPSLAGWVVAEAKGRSNAMETALKGKLRIQKRGIKTISGKPIWIALGCVASFPPQATGLRIDAFDPPNNGREATDLEVDLDQFMLAYYEPFLRAIEAASETEVRNGYMTGTFPDLGLRIGLRAGVFDHVDAASPQDCAGLADRVSTVLSNRGADEHNEFADGSRFSTEWDAALELADFEV